VVDLEEEFSHTVVDDFVTAYLRGETPNPCVRCNQHIKFTPLLRRARALGADRIATGHYARIERGVDGRARLRRGADSGKDQSYFLFSMPTHELESVMFPLGALDKDEVRRKAASYALPNAAKPESQEICFVPDGDYAGFVEAAALRRGRPLPIAGEIVDGDGAVIGRHDGIHHYTVGQRRGLRDLGSAGKPLYVQRIDPMSRKVVVGNQVSARTRSIDVRDVRWFGPTPEARVRAAVQVRHRASPVSAEITLLGERARVAFDSAAVVAAPGQAAVFYDGDTVLGGGWIAAAALPLEVAS
jgi:tRNA-specific 2-thiouridylase